MDQPDAAFKHFESIYHGYVRSLGEIWDEMVRKIMAAQEALSQSIAGPASNPNVVGHEAPQSCYAEAVRSAWTEAQERHLVAYRKYLLEYANAWQDLDLSQVPSHSLFCILESAVNAAGYARSVVNNWNLVGWAGVPPWAFQPTQGNAPAPAAGAS